MLPFNPGGHSTYQNHVSNLFLEYYPNPDSLSVSTWNIFDHFWHLDLSQVDEQMKCKYSIFGPIDYERLFIQTVPIPLKSRLGA